MRPEFRAGVQSVFERGRALAAKNAPLVFGAISGAATGYLVSPSEDKNQLVAPGALLGLAMGALKRRHVMT